MTYTTEQLRKEVDAYIRRNLYNGNVRKAILDFIDSLEEPSSPFYDYPLEYSDDDYQVYVMPGPKPELLTKDDSENYGC